MACAAAGPAMTALAVLVLWGVRSLHLLPHTGQVVLWLSTLLQVALLAVNLVPLYPRSDGAHILQGIVGLVCAPGPVTETMLRLWRPFSLAWLLLVLALWSAAARVTQDPRGTAALCIAGAAVAVLAGLVEALRACRAAGHSSPRPALPVPLRVSLL
jgi:hypothetical protein